jgi:hypothetical protein
MAKVAGEYLATEWEDDMPESVYDVILLIGSPFPPALTR